MQGENIKIEPHGILRGKLTLTQAMEEWSLVFRLALRPIRIRAERRRAGPSSCRAPEIKNSSCGSTPVLKKKMETLRMKWATPFTPSQDITTSSKMLPSLMKEGTQSLPVGIRPSVSGISKTILPSPPSLDMKRMSLQSPSPPITDRSFQAPEIKPLNCGM